MNAHLKSADWHAERKSGIGGSDANIIMSGDAARIHQLWLEKTGQAEAEDLTWVLPVRIGSATEDLNCEWYQHITGRDVQERNKMLRHRTHDFMRCELDGMTTTADGKLAILECKHVNAFGSIDEVVQRYMPQLHHNMACAGTSWAILSVIQGTQKYELFEVVQSDDFLIELIEAESDFWRHVESLTPPEGFAPILPPVSYEKLREVDMNGNNAWADHAATWVTNKKPANDFKKAVDGLKELIEADVGKAFGHGIIAKRSKAGAISISAEK